MVLLVRRTRALGCLGISPNEKGEIKREVDLFYQFTVVSQRKYPLDNFHIHSFHGIVTHWLCCVSSGITTVLIFVPWKPYLQWLTTHSKGCRDGRCFSRKGTLEDVVDGQLLTISICLRKYTVHLLGQKEMFLPGLWEWSWIHELIAVSWSISHNLITSMESEFIDLETS